jgi:uncharacterized membrane protein
MEEAIPLHPAIVHFAVVLPILTLVFEALFLYSKNETYSKVAFVLAIFSAIFVIAAWYSGGILQQTSENIYPLLNDEGKEELKEHAKLGFILAIVMSALAILKIIAYKLQKQILEIVFLVAMVALVATTLKQGKDGGELVYEFSAGIPTKVLDKHCKEE